MDNNGVTLFGTGIDFGAIQQQPVPEEEFDEEVERQREEELRNEIENAFDDLTDDEAFQENSSVYSGSRVRNRKDTSIPNNDDSNCRNSVRSIYSEEAQELPNEYMYNRVDPLNNQQQTIWSDNSDNSGNFIRQDSIIKSPTRFQLNMNDVVSRSENSESDTEHDAQIDEYTEDVPRRNNDEVDRSKLYYNNNENSQRNYLSTETSYDQLKLLYEARGRKLDKISDELAELKRTSSKNLFSLKGEVTIVRKENQILQLTKNQTTSLLTEKEGRIRSLSDDLGEKEKQCEVLEGENKDLQFQVSVAEGTINNLERHVVELQTVDSIAKSRQAHEEFLGKLKSSHDEQVEELKRKLKTATGKAEEYYRELKSIQEELTTVRRAKEFSLKENAEIIQHLNCSLEAAKQQIQVLLRTNLRKISDSGESYKSELNEKLNIAEKELQETKSELKKYHFLLKLGLFQSVNSTEDSLKQLNLKKCLKFDETNSLPIASSSDSAKLDLVNVNEKLKKELLQILFKNKKYNDEISRLNDILSKKQKLVQVMQSELKSIKGSCETLKAPELHQEFLILENTNLKKEVTCFVQHIQIVKEKGEEIIERLRNYIGEDEKDQLSSSSRSTSVIWTLTDLVQTLKKFGDLHHLMWEELKEEYHQFNSNHLTVMSNIENVKESLNNVILKSIPDSSDHITLKQLLEAFANSIKNFTEGQEYFRDGVKLQNEMWTSRLEFERIKQDNGRLKDKIQYSENAIKRIEEEKTQTMKNCKEQYLKYHEKAVAELKNTLESEYNSLKGSYEEELGIMSKKVKESQSNYEDLAREKDKLEDLYKRSKENDGLLKDAIMKQNEALKQALKEANVKYCEMDNNYKRCLEALQQPIGSNYISENVELLEAKEKVKELSYVIQALSTEIERTRNEHKKEKSKMEDELCQLQTKLAEQELPSNNENENLKGTDNNISFSQLCDTNQRFKKLNNDLREEKEKLKIYYENRIEQLMKKMHVYMKDVTNNFHLITDCKASQNEIESLKKKIEELSLMVNGLKEERKIIEVNHNVNAKALNDQIQNHEQRIKELKEDLEMQFINLSKNIHEINVEKIKYQKNADSFLKKLKQQNEKYRHLKRKFFTVKDNFSKLDIWREEREKHLINEAERIAKVSWQENEREVHGIKEYLIKSRTVLSDEVSKVIDHLRCIPEKALPQSVIEPNIYALQRIHKGILKLDIKDKELKSKEK